jgi:hypothetical protein
MAQRDENLSAGKGWCVFTLEQYESLGKLLCAAFKHGPLTWQLFVVMDTATFMCDKTVQK